MRIDALFLSAKKHLTTKKLMSYLYLVAISFNSFNGARNNSFFKTLNSLYRLKNTIFAPSNTIMLDLVEITGVLLKKCDTFIASQCFNFWVG